MSVLARSPHQVELEALIRRFFAEQSPISDARSLMTSEEGFSRSLWRRLGDQVGVQGLHVPESYGGGGGGFVDLAIVIEAAGHELVCAPLLSSVVLATGILLHSDDDRAASQLLPPLVCGDLIGTLAFTRDASAWHDNSIQVTARQDGERWMLDGTERFVLDGQDADIIFVPATTPDGITMFAVSAKADGLSRQAVSVLDQTRRLATVTFVRTEGRHVGPPGGGGRIARTALLLGSIALAAECLGGARRCLDVIVGHLKTREQFGRPIGSFQALQHRCAGLFVTVESARTLVAHAARSAATHAEDFAIMASLTKAYCCDAYFELAGECIQMLGGMGYTWEHDAHLLLKRATTNRALLGGPDGHRERTLSELGI